MKQSQLFAVEKEPMARLFDDFAAGKAVKRKKAAMASEEGRDMGAVIDALQGMTERLDAVLNGNGGGKRSRSRREREDRDDGPESAREMKRGRGREGGEIEGVLFPVNIPLGRSGDTLSCYLLTGPVRDERDLLDLAEEIDRGEFRRVLRVYKPKQQYDNSRSGGGNGGYNNGGGNSYGRDRGGYDRDRYDRR